MTNICVTIKDGKAEAKLTGVLTTGMVGVPVEFSFGPEWQDLSITAVFKGSATVIDRVLIGTDKTTVPHEVLALEGSSLWVGAEGRNAAGNLVIPSTMVKVGDILCGADPSGDVSLDPSQPVWAQVMTAVEELAETVMDSEAVSEVVADHNADATAHADIRDELLALNSSKVNVLDIINDLLTADASKPLSANMGVGLKKSIDTVAADMTEGFAKCVKTVNGVSPDATGNVVVAGGSGAAATVTVFGIAPGQSESGAAVPGSADHTAAQIKALVDGGTVPMLYCDAVYYEYSYSSTAALASFSRIEILNNYIKKHYCYINASGVLTQYTARYDPKTEDITDDHINSLIDAKLGVIENGTY